MLIDRVEEVLLGFGGGLAGGVDGLLALLGGLQAFAQAVQGLFGRISRGDERFCVLPGVDRKCVAGQCRNDGLPFIGDAFEFLVDAGLLLQAFFLGGFGGGFFVAGLLSGLHQFVEFGLFFGERGFGGGDIQRRVVGDCRVFLCAAERAGFAGLQLAAMGFQTLDAAFLFQEFLFVANLGFQGLVLLKQFGQGFFQGGDF